MPPIATHDLLERERHAYREPNVHYLSVGEPASPSGQEAGWLIDLLGDPAIAVGELGDHPSPAGHGWRVVGLLAVQPRGVGGRIDPGFEFAEDGGFVDIQDAGVVCQFMRRRPTHPLGLSAGRMVCDAS
ncbi:MAG: hypothetical protein WB765_02880 [Acidimicrobiales bacterium]